MAQLSTLGHESFWGYFGESDWQAEIVGDSVFGEIGSRHIWTAQARADSLAAGRCGSLSKVRRRYLSDIFMKIHESWPNKSPEPTAVGACGSAVAVHVTSRRWLSFFR